MLTLREIASRLTKVAWRGDSAFSALCPAHEDRTASLSVSIGREGKILFNCFVGCKAEAVLERLGLSWKDVLPEREKEQAPKTETSWTIKNAAGDEVAEHVRIEESGGKRFVWRRHGKSGLQGLSVADVPLYRTEYLILHVKGAVFICEGEKATDAAVKLGLTALGTVCGASACPSPAVLEPLRGAPVILWPDADQPGLEHMTRLAAALRPIAASVRWVVIPNARPKADAADYTGTKEELKGFIRDAPGNGPVVMFSERMTSAIRELDRLHDGDMSRYVSTGLVTLDKKLGGGLRRGQVTLLGAPAGAGKTTLVVQFAMSAEKQGLALVVSPEMSAEELVTREIVRRSGVPKWHRAPWAFASMRESAAEKHTLAASELASNPPKVGLFDALSVDLGQVIEEARRLHKNGPLSLIALDYAQQLASDDPDKPRYLAVGEVGLKAIEMAREFDCAVLITSQVNTYRAEKGEKNYSIRESANLEQKANNVVLFIVDREDDGTVKSAYFRATKVRDGALFKLDVAFDPATFNVLDQVEKQVELRDWTR